MPNSLADRSTQLEIIDRPERISSREMDVVLKELRLVNRWLGGRAACLKALSPFLLDLSRTHNRTVHVADLGAGSADISVALVTWARQNRVPLRVTSLDVNPGVCRTAYRRTSEYPEIQVVCGDVHSLPIRPKSVDIVLCSAFLHHFSDRQLIRILQRLRHHTRSFILINDLHRHKVAYWAIRLLTRLFSRSPIVQNDGPLSVMKGFRRQELDRACRSAGLTEVTIKWRWAFRWVVTARI